MLRLFSPLQRRADLNLAQFSEHWRTVHRLLALRLVDAGIMRGYVQNHRRDIDVPGLTPAGDGVPEVWVEDAGALEALATSPAYREGAALDEPNFMQGEARSFLAHSYARQPSLGRRELVGNVKLMLFAERRPGFDPSVLLDVWRDEGLILAPDAGARRTELHVAIGDPATPAAYSHVEALWWGSMAEFEEAWSHRNELRAERFTRPGGLTGMLVEELPVLWPPEEADTDN